MSFVQIMEYETDRPEELDELFNEWMSSTEGKRTASHELHTQDRENPFHYVDIVEFPSYERAMENNALPETQRIADGMRALCTDGPRFINLNVVRDDLL